MFIDGPETPEQVLRIERGQYPGVLAVSCDDIAGNLVVSRKGHCLPVGIFAHCGHSM